MKIKGGHVKLNGAEQARYMKLRQSVFDEVGWRCEQCGVVGALELHHRKPIHKGGSFWDRSNLEVLCRLCHIAHHQRERRKEIKGRVPNSALEDM